MISVGIRLADEVFPPPEEQIAKLPTGVSENPVMNLNGIDENGKARINRIVLSRTANVDLLRVESPSRVWVRLSNHITESQLTFQEPFELNKKETFTVGDYLLVPCDERVYRRGRIVEINNTTGRIKIFGIDDALIYWVEKDCLAVMPEYYMYFPWQAIQVSMVGIYPAIQSLDDQEKWPPEACEELTRILTSFPVLKVEVMLSSVVFNDYAKPIPVRMYGLESADVEEAHRTISVAELLNKSVPRASTITEVIDAAMHDVFETAETEAEPETLVEYHKSFPTDWKHKIVTEEDFPTDTSTMTPEMEHSDWDPKQNNISMLSIEDLKEKYVYPDEEGRLDEKYIMLSVEGKCTKSPYEWYARPILRVGKNDDGNMVPWKLTPDGKNPEDLKETDQADWIMYGNDQLLDFAEQLDTFYSNPKNRKPLQKEEIQRMKSDSYEVFAVCAVNEDKAAYTGEWQRVIIINCEDFAEVRFLDSGGRDMVLTSSLYRIHRQHCRFPPMCLQFAMHGISTRINQKRADKKWNIKEISNFKVSLREDVPIFIKLQDLTRLVPPPSDHRPFMKKHVILVRDVKYIGETKTVKDRFIGDDCGCAQVSEMDPVRWTD